MTNLPKPTVDHNCDPPLDIQKDNAQSTVGKVAAKAKVGRRKAAQAIKVNAQTYEDP